MNTEEPKVEEKKPKQTSILNPFIATPAVFAIFFGAQFLAVFILAGIGLLQGVDPQSLSTWVSGSVQMQALAYLLIVLVGLGLVSALLKLVHTTWKDIGLTKPKTGHILPAVIGYGWYFLIFIALNAAFRYFAPQIDFDQQQVLGFSRDAVGLSLLFIGFCLVILPAFYEEILMRGVFFTGLRSMLPLWATMLLVSVLFGAAHLEWIGENPLNFAAAIDTFALSMVLVYLRETSKSLWPAIFLHGIKNFIAFYLVFVLKIV